MLSSVYLKVTIFLFIFKYYKDHWRSPPRTAFELLEAHHWVVLPLLFVSPQVLVHGDVDCAVEARAVWNKLGMQVVRIYADG